MQRRFQPLLILVGLCWAVFLANLLLWHGRLDQHGIVPRHVGSLPAILWAPFIHASFAHLAGNTVPLLILGGLIAARGRSELAILTVAGIIVSGGLTWIVGRTASHVGASALIFCFFGYLASLAFFRRTIGSFLLSAACILLYGGMLRGIVPTSTAISWEGHVAGLVAGVYLAWDACRSNSSQGRRTRER